MAFYPITTGTGSRVRRARLAPVDEKAQIQREFTHQLRRVWDQKPTLKPMQASWFGEAPWKGNRGEVLDQHFTRSTGCALPTRRDLRGRSSRGSTRLDVKIHRHED